MRVRLANPDHQLPLPHVPGAFVGPEPFEADPASPYWSQLLADGSLVPAPPEVAETETAAPAARRR